MDVVTDGSGLREVRRKVERGERLDFDDGVALYASSDLTAIGELADAKCRERHGRRVFYNVNRHLNYSNVCALSCMFCAFAKKEGQEGAYAFTPEQIRERVDEALAGGADELHIVGGLHPDYPYSYYPELLRTISEHAPSIHLKAFTAVEIDYLAKLGGMTIEETLEDLRAAGLGSMPGGGAEVLTDRVWRKLFRDKIHPDRWLEIHERAHRVGIRTNSTLLYGHIEKPEEKVEHCIKLREVQDRTGGFMAYIPLRFHPANTPMKKLPIWRAVRSLREIAVGRLMLDNFEHVKAYWIMLGLETAQLALGYGANDMDGTVVEEKITHMAGALTPEHLAEEELRAIIREAGREPCRRDTLYRARESAA